MFNLLKTPLRALLVALTLGGVAVSPAAATRSSPRTADRDEVAYAVQNKPVNPGDADLGLLWIVLGVVVVVFFVWLCAKIGDTRNGEGMMN